MFYVRAKKVSDITYRPKYTLKSSCKFYCPWVVSLSLCPSFSDGVLLKCSELDCRYFGTGQHVQTSSSSTHIKRCVRILNTCMCLFVQRRLCRTYLSLPLYRCFPVLHPAPEWTSVMPSLAQGHASHQSICWSLSIKLDSVAKYLLF